jgi:hypothetical protein
MTGLRGEWPATNHLSHGTALLGNGADYSYSSRLLLRLRIIGDLPPRLSVTSERRLGTLMSDYSDRGITFYTIYAVDIVE